MQPLCRDHPQPQSFDRVLSSMCTRPHPDAVAAATEFLTTNPGDPMTYQSIAKIESKAVNLLADIVGEPTATGYITSGGTESNIQAVHAARNRSATKTPNIVAPESLHFSFNKAATVLNVELRTVPTDEDHRADLTAVENAVDEDTVLVVGVAGSTAYGRVDPIPELTDIAHRVDAVMHVDAAWGGFVLPFTDHAWSFAAGIDSLTIDPHKFGQATIPAGGLLVRDPSLLDELAIETPYLESPTQATLTGTRSGAGVAGALAAMEALWPHGYKETYERTMYLAERLETELSTRGFETVTPHLPLVAADIPRELFTALRSEGWRIATTADGTLRIVCMPHVTQSLCESFLSDLDRVRRAGNSA